VRHGSWLLNNLAAIFATINLARNRRRIMARIVPIATCSVMLLLTQPAFAGLYTDDLTRCVVKSSSTADQQLLVQWMFAELSLNPAVKPLSSIAPEQRDSLEVQGASLFVRLVADNCRNEAISALKNEGPIAFGQSFQTLGQVAARGLMTDPAVTEGMKSFGKHMSGDPRLSAMLKEAGVPVPVPVPSAGPGQSTK